MFLRYRTLINEEPELFLTSHMYTLFLTWDLFFLSPTNGPNFFPFKIGLVAQTPRKQNQYFYNVCGHFKDRGTSTLPSLEHAHASPPFLRYDPCLLSSRLQRPFFCLCDFPSKGLNSLFAREFLALNSFFAKLKNWGLPPPPPPPGAKVQTAVSPLLVWKEKTEALKAT